MITARSPSAAKLPGRTSHEGPCRTRWLESNVASNWQIVKRPALMHSVPKRFIQLTV